MSGQLTALLVLFGALLGAAPKAPAARAPESLVLELQETISAGDLARAQAGVDAALRKYPRDGGLYNLRGIILAQQGDLAGAESSFTAAVRYAPQLSGAQVNLVRVLHQRGEYARSQQLILRLPEKAQQTVRVATLACGNLAALGKNEAAEKIAKVLLDTGNLDEQAVLDIAPALQKAGLQGMAAEMLQRLQTPAARAVLAGLAERANDLAAARKLFDEVAREQQEAGPLLDLARVAYKQRDYEGALGYLAHARDLRPADAGIHFFFGMVCVEMNLPVEARNALLKAVELAPEQPYYRYALGAVTLQGFNAEDAVPHFESYVKSRPEDARGRFALAVARYQTGRYEDAESTFRELSKDASTAGGAFYYLGRIARSNGNLEESVKLFDAAAQAIPEHADSHAELGLSYLRLGDAAKAEGAIRKALQLDSENRAANRNLLILYRQNKDPRADAQKQRVDELEKKHASNRNLLLRTLDIRPYK